MKEEIMQFCPVLRKMLYNGFPLGGFVVGGSGFLLGGAGRCGAGVGSGLAAGGCVGFFALLCA
jgi:hypothetical protein